MNDGFKEAPFPKPHHSGHRDRLRQRFMTAGEAALADYELLEMVLFRALPRRDTKPLAKLLMDKFGSFAEVISASPLRLQEVKGVGDAVVTELKIVQAAALRLSRTKILNQTLLNSWGDLLNYCQASMAYNNIEQFRILFLNRKNAIIADEVQQQGTINHTPVYVREVVKRALELSATSIILCHNHPSGDPTPSRADIELTRKIIDAASKLDVQVHDHVIIGRDGHASLRGLQLI